MRPAAGVGVANDETVLMRRESRSVPRVGRLRAIDVPLMVIALILAVTLASAIGSSARRAHSAPTSSAAPTLAPAPTAADVAPQGVDRADIPKDGKKGKGKGG